MKQLQVYLHQSGNVFSVMSGEKARYSRQNSILLAEIPHRRFELGWSTFYGVSPKCLKSYCTKYYVNLLSLLDHRFERNCAIGETHFDHTEFLRPNYWSPWLYQEFSKRNVDVVYYLKTLKRPEQPANRSLGLCI